MANRSTERILTTHTGSLPRPDDLRALLATLDRGEPVDRDEFDGAVRSAVDAVVARQREAGIATAAQAALVDSRIVYAKLRSLVEGAELVSGELWHGRPVHERVTLATDA